MVDVTSGTAGNYNNSSSGITTAETGATAGPASNAATLAVGGISISKSFAATDIGVGERTTLTFNISSTVATAQTAMTFTDTFPGSMTVASPLTTSNTCGGTLRNGGNTANTSPGDAGLSLQGGTLAASGNCSIAVDVTIGAAGTFSNTSSAVTSTPAGLAGPVSNTAVLTGWLKPTISEAFSPSTLDTYRNSTLTFTLNNPNASALTSCNFTDTLTGFAVSSPPSIGGTCTGVTSTPALVNGATSLNLTVPSLSGSCTVSVPVTSGSAGTYPNAASGVKCAQQISAGAAAASASVTFTKLPISLLKSASVVNAPPGSTVAYTISYANPNGAMPLRNIVITDVTPPFTSFTSAACGALPASLTSCTISAPAVGATGTVTWTLGGSLDPGASGTVTITVTVN
jgi:uncharacterized repeat protein (TIGR01451 family)